MYCKYPNLIDYRNHGKTLPRVSSKLSVHVLSENNFLDTEKYNWSSPHKTHAFTRIYFSIQLLSILVMSTCNYFGHYSIRSKIFVWLTYSVQLIEIHFLGLIGRGVFLGSFHFIIFSIRISLIRLNRYINLHLIISIIDLHIYKFSQSTSKKLNSIITFKFDMTQFSETALKSQEQ